VPYGDLDALMSASEKYDAAVLAAPIRSSLA